MKEDTIVNLSDVKTFHNPHPGLAGALASLPSSVKKVAEELSGRTLPLQEAVEKIQAVTEGKVTPVLQYNYISLHIGAHAFRVISYS